MARLSSTASFWTAALVAGLALWASGAPTVVYPLYARAWGLPPAVTSLIFAVYPLTLIPVLLLFGNLSDVIGRRRTILLGRRQRAVAQPDRSPGGGRVTRASTALRSASVKRRFRPAPGRSSRPSRPSALNRARRSRTVWGWQ